ncbi:mercury methylation corrinoid protein HgcA [Desulfobacterales bacterium HSG17]|nr:mercury methylation corrinoid protein HgcA [Desulfobacterales bacterium HSG17]
MKENELRIIPLVPEHDEDIPCCGGPAGPKSSPYDLPGYNLCSFVERFNKTIAGQVPEIKSRLEIRDILGTISARLGMGRNNYTISPGLYCIGNPGTDSPVLLSANYKLSFDTLRKNLEGADAWIVILDTRGINVWCAAGKGTFSTDEVINRVIIIGLDKIVRHKKLILPQLSAVGVSARQVKKRCGFKVIWGPVRAVDIKAFISNGMKAKPPMRKVSFSIWERLVLVPVEINILAKHAKWLLPAFFLLSGTGPDIFSIAQAWSRGILLALAALTGVFAGAFAVPVLLPWIPGTMFAVKGVQTGIISGLFTAIMCREQIQGAEALALILFTTAISSYLAMNFTGSTPFTSPSGVEKEMRKAIPIQAVAIIISVLLWIGSAFL